MAIKGVTDQTTLAKRKPKRPEIGRLRKGGAKGTSKRGGWQGGDNLPYFRFTSEDPTVVAAFKATYGDKPKFVRVYFLDDKSEDAFDTWVDMKMAGGRLLWRGDGEHLIGRFDKSTKKWINLTGQNKPQPDGGKECGYMTCVVPELAKAGLRGVVKFNTSGSYDVRNISTELYDAYKQYGTVKGVPFILFRVEEWISYEKDGKTIRRKENNVHIALASDYEAKVVELMGQEDEDYDFLEDDNPQDGEIGNAGLVREPTDPLAPEPATVPPTNQSAPTSMTQLWGEKMWQPLGYNAHKHAQNTVKKHCPKDKMADVVAVWEVLVEHAPNKKLEAVGLTTPEEQEILDEIAADGTDEVPEFPFVEEDDIPF